MPLPIHLITGWENDRPQFRRCENRYPIQGEYLDNTLTAELLSGHVGACGNLHAGQGSTRIIINQDEILPAKPHDLSSIIGSYLPSLGDKILVSAGHYMPVKKDPYRVNGNSCRLLDAGLGIVKAINRSGKQADLLITINDVTLHDTAEETAYSPTMNSDERRAYYENFELPALYRKKILDTYQELNREFITYAVGENKLSERLTKMANKLADIGAFVHSREPNGYRLNFDTAKMMKLAHNTTVPPDAFFISNTPGVRGRPKCVRACTKLAALPHEMGYTGFIQYLPVCSRNALEGFLIGSEIFSRRYGKVIPYISVHTTRSCF